MSHRLSQIENALGAEEHMEILRRIEVAVDPMARAKHDVEQLMRELDAALQQDPNHGYEHSRVTEIQEQLEKGERPQREVWESRIKTPFPWA